MRDAKQASSFAFMLFGRLRLSSIGIHLKGLILAQNERWRRGLGMQVERQVNSCLQELMEERQTG